MSRLFFIALVKAGAPCLRRKGGEVRGKKRKMIPKEADLYYLCFHCRKQSWYNARKEWFFIYHLKDMEENMNLRKSIKGRIIRNWIIAAGKEKSATYRQYFGNRMLYKMMLDRYKEYGLVE